jgi:malate dehydrogenase (quinone)
VPLNGKVYTLQIEKLPFAAIHGDLDIGNPKETRFGPTAKVLPLLERHHYATVPDFFKTSVFRIEGVLSLLKILSEPILFKYVIKNFGFDLPFIEKYMFIQEVKKIVPSIKLSELKFRRKVGGIRPQIVNTNEKKLVMGEAKILGNKIIFNITPSPGASVCLQNAYNDTQSIMGFLGKGFRFDSKKFEKELG